MGTAAESVRLFVFLMGLGILLSLSGACGGRLGIPIVEMFQDTLSKQSAPNTEESPDSAALLPPKGNSSSRDSSGSQGASAGVFPRTTSGSPEGVQSAGETAPEEPWVRQGWVRAPAWAGTGGKGGDNVSSSASRPNAAEASLSEEGQAGFRWHYPDLEQLLSQEDHPETILQEALASNDPIIAANAAIVLGRQGNSEVVSRLAETVRDRRLQMGTRLAAAEALGYVRTQQQAPASSASLLGNWRPKMRGVGSGQAGASNTSGSAGPSPGSRAAPPEQGDKKPGRTEKESVENDHVAAVLRELVDEYGQYEGPARRRYLPELHGELLRSLARHGEVGSEPRFRSALRSPSPLVQQAALEAWQWAKGPLPEEAADLRTSQDAAVRAAALRVLAQHRHPEAFGWLRSGLADSDWDVRLTAIESLGRWGGPDSRELLRPLLQDPTERIRVAAVHALAQADDQQALVQAAGDSSWRVRQAAAEALARFPTPTGRELALRLLKDPSASVSAAVIRAVRQWPLVEAGPVLLEALERDSFLIRREAAAQLSERWAPAKEFMPNAPPERRKEVLAKLVQSFRNEMAAQRSARAEMLSSAPADSSSNIALSEEQWAEVENALAVLADPSAPASEVENAKGRLKALGPRLVGVAQTWVCQRKRFLPEPVFQELLPSVSPEFLLLERLRLGEVSWRRRAAAELAQQAKQTPLTPLAVERLTWIVSKESDPIVWQNVLEAIGEDGSEPAMRLAVAALGHPAPEVRRAACGHFRRHPEPAYRNSLLALAEDDQDAVALAALEALGVVGLAPNDASCLERLLGHRNPEVVLRAASLLAGLGRSSGLAALERLAYHENPAIRRQTAQIMGSLGHPGFVPILIQLLDEGHGIPRAALESLAKIVRTPPPELQKPNASLSEQAAAWKHWWSNQARQASFENISPEPSMPDAPAGSSLPGIQVEKR